MRPVCPPRAARAAALLLAAALATGCGDRGTPAPGFAVRGVIEGYYGTPYTTGERARLLRFVGERGMNAYVYAPKSDPKHRDQWREPYTAEELTAFGELASIGSDAGVRFVFALSPGITFDPNDPADFGRLEAKLRAVHEAGVRGFALLLDDIFSKTSPALDPSFQAELVARVGALVRGFGPDVDFWFIGNLYAGTAEQFRDGTIDARIFLFTQPPADYYDAYARSVPTDIPILWTGPSVISAALRTPVARAFHEFARRPVIAWDNYPVNDTLPADLFLGPVVGRDPDLADGLEGVVFNLMTQPTAGLVPIATGADYLRDPRAYDPERSFEDAVAAVGGSGAAAFRRFAGVHRGHPLLEGAVEAPELGERIAAAFADGAGSEAAAGLRGELEALAATRAELEATLDDAALGVEIAPWAQQLEVLSRAGLLGLDALDGRATATDYRAARDAALASKLFVAKDDAPGALGALVGGPVHRTDRFGDLFAAIDARLGAGS